MVEREGMITYERISHLSNIEKTWPRMGFVVDSSSIDLD